MLALKLRTFGGLSLENIESGATVGTSSRKPLAILAVLAASERSGLHRDVIASLLWSDLDDVRARRSLAQSLYALRRELQAEVLDGGAQLVMRDDVLPTDVRDFESLVERNAKDGSRQSLIALTQCYRGPFLDGVHYHGCAEFDHWVDASRARFERRFVAVVHAFATSTPDKSAAMDVLEAGVRRVPQSAQLALLLSRYLADYGRGSEALNVLSEHKAAVRRLFDEDASDDVTRAIAELRAGVRSTSPRIAVAPVVEEAGVAPPAATIEIHGSQVPSVATRARTSRNRWAMRSAVVLVAAMAIFAYPVWSASRGKAGTTQNDNRVLEAFKRVRGMDGLSLNDDSSRIGRVIIFSPSELSGRPQLRALAPRITNQLYEEIGREVRDIVPLETVRRLERDAEAIAEYRPTSVERYQSIMEVADAAVGILVTYQERGDSIHMFLERYVRSYRWHVRPQDDNPDRRSKAMVVPSVSRATMQYGSGPMKSFDVVNRMAASRMRSAFASMASCVLDDHVDYNAAGMCWISRHYVHIFSIELSEYRRHLAVRNRRSRHVYDSLIKAGRDPNSTDSALFRKLRTVSCVEYDLRCMREAQRKTFPRVAAP